MSQWVMGSFGNNFIINLNIINLNILQRWRLQRALQFGWSEAVHSEGIGTMILYHHSNFWNIQVWKFERFCCKGFYHSESWAPDALNKRIEFVAVTNGDNASSMRRISEGVSLRSTAFTCFCYPPFHLSFKDLTDDSTEIRMTPFAQ